MAKAALHAPGFRLPSPSVRPDVRPLPRRTFSSKVPYAFNCKVVGLVVSKISKRRQTKVSNYNSILFDIEAKRTKFSLKFCIETNIFILSFFKYLSVANLILNC